eukprot:scaffold207_cov409-Prasinococcus_capsulatus_cf.AAC.102
MSVGELACTYASLILADDDVEITVRARPALNRHCLRVARSAGCTDAARPAENISKVCKAANVEMEPYWPMLFAKFLEGKDIKDMLSNVGVGGGGGAPAPAAAGGGGGGGGAAAAAPEPEPEEEEEEEDMGFDLFD